MMNVPYVKSRSPFQERLNDVEVPGQRSLMQRCGMGVKANGIVPVRVLTRFEKQPYNLGMSILRGQSESLMPLRRICGRQLALNGFEAPDRCRCDEIHPRAPKDQCVNRLEFTMDQRRRQCAIWIGAIAAQ